MVEKSRKSRKAEDKSQEVEPLLNGLWALGYRDRGHDHGDYAVMTKDGKMVVECPNLYVSQHIITLHNKSVKRQLHPLRRIS